MNGLAHFISRYYVKDSCPFYETDFWSRREVRKGKKIPDIRRIALWVDVEKHMKSDLPDHIQLAIRAMAKFQKWIHGRNVRFEVKKIIEGFCNDTGSKKRTGH